MILLRVGEVNKVLDIGSGLGYLGIFYLNDENKLYLSLLDIVRFLVWKSVEFCEVLTSLKMINFKTEREGQLNQFKGLTLQL